MNLYLPGQGWDLGGPMVLHSPWWIEEHWGRLFEVERLVPSGFFDDDAGARQDDHGAVTLVKRPGEAPSREELERLDSAEGREATALFHEVRHLRAESAALRAVVDHRAPVTAESRPVSGREAVRALWAAAKRRLG
jgi:hypothetical protein